MNAAQRSTVSHAGVRFSRPPAWVAPGLLGAGGLARSLESAAHGAPRREIAASPAPVTRSGIVGRTRVYRRDEAMRPGSVGLACVSALGIAVLGVGSAGTGGSVKAAAAATRMNVNVSQRPSNESEETVAVNPTDPRNIVIETNIAPRAAGLFEAVSFD